MLRSGEFGKTEGFRCLDASIESAVKLLNQVIKPNGFHCKQNHSPLSIFGKCYSSCAVRTVHKSSLLKLTGPLHLECILYTNTIWLNSKQKCPFLTLVRDDSYVHTILYFIIYILLKTLTWQLKTSYFIKCQINCTKCNIWIDVY